MPKLPKPIADLARSLPKDKGFALISNRSLYGLYALAVYARAVQAWLGALDGKTRPVAGPEAEAWRSTPNEEAILAAVLLDLGRADVLAPGCLRAASAVLKGIEAKELLGKPAGSRVAGRRVAWSRHGLIPATLEPVAQLDAAIEAARVAASEPGRGGRSKKRRRIVVALIGAPEVEPARMRRALKLAVAEKLPLLFVADVPAASEELRVLGEKSGAPSVIADRSDALALYRVVTESAAHARRGNGPTLIECRAWPLAASGPDAVEQLAEALRRRGIYTARLARQTQAVVGRLLPRS